MFLTELFFLLQNASTRSPFSDYTVISSHSFVDRQGKNQESELILTVSNWHFNRDTMSQKEGVRCCPEDCIISLKLASTTFKGASQASVEDSNCYLVDDHNYSFDRHGVAIPYSAFVSLMDNKDFTDYLVQVKDRYEQAAGSLEWNVENQRNQETEEAEGSGSPPSKKTKKSQKNQN